MVFVYGTLMPGHVRWPLIQDGVVALRRASITGRIYDTGQDYPALRLGDDGVVHGWVLDLDPPRTAELLDRLDEIEGAAGEGLYERSRVMATDHAGGHANVWVYEYGAEPTGLTRLAGRWTGA